MTLNFVPAREGKLDEMKKKKKKGKGEVKWHLSSSTFTLQHPLQTSSDHRSIIKMCLTLLSFHDEIREY